METSRSPRRALRVAYRLALRVLPHEAVRVGDFTLAQLFACLVLRTFYGLSYRRTEALLRDSPQWLADLGIRDAPDHNTLWRAFGRILVDRQVGRMLDLLTKRFAQAGVLRPSAKPLALDSTCFERRHRSAHYDRRCRQMAAAREAIGPGGEKRAEKPGKWGDSVNASRSRQVSAMPKLSVAVAGACHVILAAVVRLGNGSDAPDFDELLYRAWRRAPGIKVVVADAGYDSEMNHRIARQDMSVRSIIPPGIGRPTSKLPSGRWRRHMAKRFKRKADQPQYAQRNQSETVHSMLKRNGGSALRSRTPERRKQEMMLRVLTHNIALAAELGLDDEE
jgi:IS5 family transposase